MSAENITTHPKYACKECGSVEVRSELNGYEVFRAEGDQLIHLRSECMEAGLIELHCLSCHEPIEVDDFGSIKFA